MASASNECQPLPLSRAKPLTRLALAEIAVYVAIGPQAVTITLSATCDTSGTRRMPSHQPQTRRFERPPTLRPLFTELRFYTFPGGCATYWFHFARDASPLLARSVDGAVAFMPRARLVAYIEKTEGLALCGRGAPCPG